MANYLNTDAINKMIENGARCETLMSLYSDDTSTELTDKNLRLINKIIDEDEKYAIVYPKGYKSRLLITDKGRLINLKTCRILGVSVIGTFNLNIICSGVNFKTIFKKQGWEFDVDKILKYYDEIGYHYNLKK